MIDSDHASALEPFTDQGWISEILYEVKSGKEATVFCCRGGPRSPVPLLAAKVYRPIQSRRFKNDGMYIEGRVHMARAGRVRRAVQAKSDFGRDVQYGTWIAQEWETLNLLHGAGADVPEPLAIAGQAVLMPFLGDAEGPSPMLNELGATDLEPRIVARIVDDLLWNIELMLDHDCVHGDLSPFNIMFHDDRAVIIDFPQAIDPRLNRNGAGLLARDVGNVCAWAQRRGVSRPGGRITSRLWARFVNGELG